MRKPTLLLRSHSPDFNQSPPARSLVPAIKRSLRLLAAARSGALDDKRETIDKQADEDESAEVVFWEFEGHKPHFRLLLEESWYASSEFLVSPWLRSE